MQKKQTLFSMSGFVQLSLVAALALYGGAGTAQAQAPTGTQTVYFADAEEGGTFSRSPGSAFTTGVWYNDDGTDRSVVSFRLHWDTDVLEFGGVENIKAVADQDDAACRVSGAVPAGVTDAGDNTKIGGDAISGAVNFTGEAEPAGNADGIAETDMTLQPTWAQICGDVFTENDPVKLFDVTFTWKEDASATETKLALTKANGGDYQYPTFEGVGVAFVPQSFNLAVKGGSAPVNFDDVILIARAVGFAAGPAGIPEALLARGITLGAGTTSTDVKANIVGGGDLLDVDESGTLNFDDVILIARAVGFAAGPAAIPEALLVRGITLPAGVDAAQVKANIAALVA